LLTTLQDVAAILPTATPEQVTGSVPGDPRSLAQVRNANGQFLAAQGDASAIPQQMASQVPLPGNSNEFVQALGIMQSTRVNAGSGSIFSSLTNDQARMIPMIRMRLRQMGHP